MKHIVYIDMDGVLADFEGKAKEWFGEKWKEEVEQTGWGRFVEHPDVYDVLSPMPDALELYEGCCRIVGNKSQVQILTALPSRAKFDRAAQDKITWARRCIDPDIRVSFGPYAKDKQFHLRHSGDVLIDDMARNIDQWNEQGGIGILHTSAQDSLIVLGRLWRGVQHENT
jgi:hypothetical protein